MKIAIARGEDEPVLIPAVFSPAQLRLASLIHLKANTGLTYDEVEWNTDYFSSKRTDEHDAGLATGLVLWLSRTAAGEVLTLDQACDLEPGSWGFIPEPQDEPGQTAEDPATPPPARRASGQAAARPADRKRKTTRSKKASASS